MKNAIIVTISLFLLSCTATGDAYMQQDDLLRQINRGRAPTIVDVRSDAEYQSGHVPGAIHIPFWTAFTTDKMDGYKKDDIVVLYCAHGPRAWVAKLAFNLAGFNGLRYLTGHMTAWTKAGLPVE